MTKRQRLEQLQDEWDQAAHRAAERTERPSDLGDMLTESSGLHIKSGVKAGGLWGTTSCTCAHTCGENTFDPATCD